MNWYDWTLLYLIVSMLLFLTLFHGGGRDPN